MKFGQKLLLKNISKNFSWKKFLDGEYHMGLILLFSIHLLYTSCNYFIMLFYCRKSTPQELFLALQTNRNFVSILEYSSSLLRSSNKATTDHHCDFAGSGNINGWRQGDQLIICSGWCTWNDVLRWCDPPKDSDDMWNVVLRWCHLSTDLAKSNPGGFWWNLVGARQNLLVGNWNNGWNSIRDI